MINETEKNLLDNVDNIFDDSDILFLNAVSVADVIFFRFNI